MTNLGKILQKSYEVSKIGPLVNLLPGTFVLLDAMALVSIIWKKQWKCNMHSLLSLAC